jgi:two-component system chemotaxis response regulator CheB
MINVLIVDDSPTIRQLIRGILTRDPELRVIGEAQNGQEAIKMAARLRPDVVTMDIQMPLMDGYQAIRHIMSETPVPIVVLTSTESDIRLGITYKGVESGALTVIGKPHGLPGDDPEADELINVVKAMAGVKVIRRKWHSSAGPLKTPARQRAVSSLVSSKPYQIAALGCSTGGPPALRTVLGELPATFPVPVVVVQHISKGFTAGLARWLNESVGMRVKVAEKGEPLLPGSVYLAPDGAHFQVTSLQKVGLLEDNPMDGHIPSVTALFNSVAKQYRNRAVGVLMTGMGRDGANGLYAMMQEGAYTIAQDKATSIVFGMPKEAIQMGAAKEVLALQKIGQRMKELIS